MMLTYVFIIFWNYDRKDRKKFTDNFKELTTMKRSEEKVKKEEVFS